MRKISLFILLLPAMPIITVAQKQLCTINVHATGNYQPVRAELKLTLDAQQNLKAAFKDNTATITDSLVRPRLAELWMFDKSGKPLIEVQIYIAPGIVNINYDEQGASSTMTVEGPQLSHDYEAILNRPSLRYLTEIEELKMQLKQPGQDTSSLKIKINTATHAYYEGLRNYIKAHPGSPLSIVALEMMGLGEPGISKPVKEVENLFYSLSLEIRNSEEGIQYAKYEEGVWRLQSN